MTIADSIFTNGKIATLDSQNTVVEAIAVKNGFIIARGTTDEIRSLAGDTTQEIDLGAYTTLMSTSAIILTTCSIPAIAREGRQPISRSCARF